MFLSLKPLQNAFYLYRVCFSRKGWEGIKLFTDLMLKSNKLLYLPQSECKLILKINIMQASKYTRFAVIILVILFVVLSVIN